MRLLLSVLGVFTAVVCIEKPAEAEQNYPWCINKPDEIPAVPVRNIRTMLGRSTWERRVLFT
jgi:hypothetical protein